LASALTVTDDAGQHINLAAPASRIVSIAPGATEMLFTAGAGSHVIATVQYSDEPPAARLVPRIGDFVSIDMERLVALHPDVVVVWPGGGNAAQIEEIGRLGIPLYRQQVSSLADLAGSLRRLGTLAGTGEVAERAAQDLQARLARLAALYAAKTHPSVLLEVWNHPMYTVGGSQLMSDALQICGVRNVFGDLRDQSPAVDMEAVIARDPDIIIAAPPPGAGADWLADWKRFTALKAVRTGKLIVFDDPNLSRLGPSVVAATEVLCKLIAAVR
jgi:iron complex transport system substrate-binding protein